MATVLCPEPKNGGLTLSEVEIAVDASNAL
jgi:hypothetical protein